LHDIVVSCFNVLIYTVVDKCFPFRTFAFGFSASYFVAAADQGTFKWFGDPPAAARLYCQRLLAAA